MGRLRALVSWLIDGRLRRSLGRLRAPSLSLGEWMLEEGTDLWRELFVKHTLTTLALAISLVLILLMPQTTNVLWQFPPLMRMDRGEVGLAVLFVLTTLGLFVFYLWLASRLRPPVPGGPPAPGSEVGPADRPRGRRGRVPVPRPASDSGFGPADRLSSRGWLILGVIVLLVSGLLASLAVLRLQGRWVPGASPGWIGPSLLLGLAGLWAMVVSHRMRREPGSKASQVAGPWLRLLVRGLGLVSVSSLLGILLWYLPFFVKDVMNHRLYTVWAVFHIVFLLTTLARIVDARQRVSSWNVRVMTVAALAVVLVLLPAEPVGRFVKSTPRYTPPGLLSADDATVEQSAWFDALESRLNALPTDGPVVIVAASGGGSRASLFTALVLEALRRQPGKGWTLREPVLPIVKPQGAGLPTIVSLPIGGLSQWMTREPDPSDPVVPTVLPRYEDVLFSDPDQPPSPAARPGAVLPHRTASLGRATAAPRTTEDSAPAIRAAASPTRSASLALLSDALLLTGPWQGGEGGKPAVSTAAPTAPTADVPRVHAFAGGGPLASGGSSALLPADRAALFASVARHAQRFGLPVTPLERIAEIRRKTTEGYLTLRPRDLSGPLTPAERADIETIVEFVQACPTGPEVPPTVPASYPALTFAPVAMPPGVPPPPPPPAYAPPAPPPMQAAVPATPAQAPWASQYAWPAPPAVAPSGVAVPIPYRPVPDSRVRLPDSQRQALFLQLLKRRQELPGASEPLRMVLELRREGTQLYRALLANHGSERTRPESERPPLDAILHFDSSATLNAAEQQDLEQMLESLFTPIAVPPPLYHYVPAGGAPSDEGGPAEPEPSVGTGMGAGASSVGSTGLRLSPVGSLAVSALPPAPPITFGSPPATTPGLPGPRWVLPPDRAALRLDNNGRGAVGDQLLRALQRRVPALDAATLRGNRDLTRQLLEEGERLYASQLQARRLPTSLRSIEKLDVKLMIDQILANPQGLLAPIRIKSRVPGDQVTRGVPAPQLEAMPIQRARLLDHVAFISSVSGGSLATAYYLHYAYPHLRLDRDFAPVTGEIRGEAIPAKPGTEAALRPSWQSSDQGEVFLRMQELAESMWNEAKQRGPSAGATRPASGPESSDLLRAIESAAGEAMQLRERNFEALKIAPWLPESAFVDDMARDFLAPLLRGLVDLGTERGTSVTRYWEQLFGWEQLDDTDLHVRFVPAPVTIPRMAREGWILWGNAAPLALFNACDAEQGSRVIVGVPPLPARLIDDSLAVRPEARPYSLRDRSVGNFHVRLAEAVRLSANFPWGFETARLQLRADGEPAYVVDGGIVDNTGIDSIVHLLRGLKRQADTYEALLAENRFGETTDFQRRSHRALAELRRRGILLIEIDSGTKQIGTTRTGLFASLARVAPFLFRPIQALNNASYANAALATSDYDVILQSLTQPDSDLDLTGEGGERPPELANLPPLVRRVRLTCNHIENVQTTWSLGPRDKAVVFLQFLIEWYFQGPVLQATLDQLTETAALYRQIAQSRDPGKIKRLAELSAEYARVQRGLNLADSGRSLFYARSTGANTDAIFASLPPEVFVMDPDQRQSYDTAVRSFRQLGQGALDEGREAIRRQERWSSDSMGR